MAASLQGTKTMENLMRAFAGESQARNRYTFAAACAKKKQLYVIEQVFQFTANQEKEHAEVFYNFLKEVAGSNINVDGNYPTDLYDDPIQLLKAAQHNEYQEFEHDYQHFADVAKEEGFNQISNTFRMIAAVEKTHGDRFGRYASALENGSLFKGGEGIRWMCLNCGYIHEGPIAPQQCPVCSHDQGYFIRLSEAPFQDRKSTRLNSSHSRLSRMPSSA